MGRVPGGFLFVPDFLQPAEQAAVLAELRGLAYGHDRFRGQRLKRAQAHFGFAYRSAGRRLAPADPLPEFLRAVLGRALPHCPPGTEFQQGTVSRYPPGSGIGWHVDAPVFGECVLGVSLGGPGRLQFRAVGAEGVESEVTVGPGSLYLMRGPARWAYQHRVVPVRAERYSLTFRQVPKEGTG